jgi:hypothetical protein
MPVLVCTELVSIDITNFSNMRVDKASLGLYVQTIDLNMRVD